LQFYLTVIYRNLLQVTDNVTGALNPTNSYRAIVSVCPVCR